MHNNIITFYNTYLTTPGVRFAVAMLFPKTSFGTMARGWGVRGDEKTVHLRFQDHVAILFGRN